MKKIFWLLTIAFVFVSFAFYIWVTEDGPLNETTTIVVSRGSTVRSISRDMYKEGILAKPRLFEILARFKKVDRGLMAGEYAFSPKISIVKALDKIERGEVFYRKITIPEGLTNKQVFRIINNVEYLTGDISVELGEGEMLAETYVYSRGDTRDSIIDQAKKALEIVLDEAWENRKNFLLMEKNDALILASIIEKETSIPSERGLVASVFVNRLKKGMRLQTDPTVIYAITKGDDTLGRSLKKADMKIDSPYNTYLYVGLPPTPICNTSAASIAAALNPEQSDFLYFVADGKGGHNFSETYDAHRGHIKSWVNQIRSVGN